MTAQGCIVAGVDCSRASRDALDVTVRLARDLGALRGLVLAHAYPGERQLWLENGSELAWGGHLLSARFAARCGRSA